MPIYEYEREDGTRFEKLHREGDEELTKCPETGQKVRRLISSSAFHLKGSGWYKTDYAKSSSSSSSSGSSGSSEKSSTSENSCTGTGPTGGCKSCSSD